MYKENKNKGFTLIELLVVVGIIALLLSLALPAFNVARDHVREVGDRAAINTIATGIEAFAGDMGHYPQSRLRESSPYPEVTDPLMIVGGVASGTECDQGAHRIYEAMVGLDTLGYQKDHYYEVDGNTGEPIAPDRFGNPKLTKRYGPYLDLDNIKTGTMGEAHPGSDNYSSGENTNMVFVDSLNRDNPRAILYYKANKSKYSITAIYDYADNEDITLDVIDGDSIYPEFDNIDDTEEFEKYLWDPTTGVGADADEKFDSAYARPYKKDGFILINAGKDGRYGTDDDITNFTVKDVREDEEGGGGP